MQRIHKATKPCLGTSNSCPTQILVAAYYASRYCRIRCLPDMCQSATHACISLCSGWRACARLPCLTASFADQTLNIVRFFNGGCILSVCHCVWEPHVTPNKVSRALYILHLIVIAPRYPGSFHDAHTERLKTEMDRIWSRKRLRSRLV